MYVNSIFSQMWLLLFWLLELVIAFQCFKQPHLLKSSTLRFPSLFSAETIYLFFLNSNPLDFLTANIEVPQLTSCLYSLGTTQHSTVCSILLGSRGFVYIRTLHLNQIFGLPRLLVPPWLFQMKLALSSVVLINICAICPKFWQTLRNGLYI